MPKINQCFNSECLCKGSVTQCCYALQSLDGKCLYHDKLDNTCCNGLARRAYQSHVENGTIQRMEVLK